MLGDHKEGYSAPHHRDYELGTEGYQELLPSPGFQGWREKLERGASCVGRVPDRSCDGYVCCLRISGQQLIFEAPLSLPPLSILLFLTLRACLISPGWLDKLPK